MAAISDIVGDILREWVEEREAHMKQILQRDKWPKNEENSPLYASIAPDVEVVGEGYKVTIALDEYYVFIDEGVMGVDGQTKTSGKIRFKSLNVSRSMIESLKRWGARKKLRGVTSANMNQRAWANAITVKKEGIRQTSFFTTPTSDTYINQLAQSLSEGLGKDYEISFEDI
jgi:hypothetical protein